MIKKINKTIKKKVPYIEVIIRVSRCLLLRKLQKKEDQNQYSTRTQNSKSLKNKEEA
jgi:hypothetical protein